MKIPKQKKRGPKLKYDYNSLKVNSGTIEGPHGLMSLAINYASRNNLKWKFASTREGDKETIWRIK